MSSFFFSAVFENSVSPSTVYLINLDMDPLLQPIIFDNPCPGHATGLPGLLFTQIVQYLISAQCGLGNSKDYPADYGDSLVDNQEFDFIVVGAGIILFGFLTEKKFQYF